MITKQTVFILGAGASYPYGYPTANTLLNQIVSSTRKPIAELFLHLKELGCDTDLIRVFHEQLRDCDLASVDRFLENNPKFIEIGKLAIGHTLLKCELREKLNVSADENWYRWLLKKITDECADLKKFSQNRVSIVSFNYDRSLREYLLSRLSASYGISREDAAESLDWLKFFHVYGDLGNLPEFSETEAHPYGEKITGERTRIAANRIRIVSDERSADHFKLVSNEINSASTVIFLGFGFDRKNVERLQIRWGPERAVYGSAYGITRVEAKDLEKKYVHLNLGHESQGCLKYLRETLSTTLFE